MSLETLRLKFRAPVRVPLGMKLRFDENKNILNGNVYKEISRSKD